MRTPFFPLFRRFVFLACAIWTLDASAAQSQNDKLNDSQIATKLGIKVQQVHGLRAAFNLSTPELIDLTQAQLAELLRDLEHPGIEKQREHMEERLEMMRDENGRIPPDGLMRALEHRKHLEEEEDLTPVPPEGSTNVISGEPGTQAAGLQTNSWTWLGPGNIGGRVRAIIPHPTLTNVLYCGGVDGGVWKTTNNAASWFPLNDFMPNLAVSCMAMDPANPNIIYAGTGEPTYNADAIRGAGIFKTVNAGTNWFQLGGTANSSWFYVSRLSIDPNNGLIMLAATRNGIFRSTNGGTNWTQVASTEMNDVDFHPTNSSLAIAAGRAGNAFYSTNGGVNWLAASGLTGGRVEVAYCRSSPNVVYASVDNSNGQVYSSGDGGQTYALRNSGNNYLNTQGWYDNALWTDPTTTNIVIVGGLDLYRSADGGATLTKISQWFSAPNSAHADHHVIVQSSAFNGSTVNTVFFGNDGGIYRANSVYTVSLTSGWQELNNNLGITQFYGGAGNTNTGVIVGGTQDNGDLRYTTSSGTEGWNTWNGGDGGYSAADRTDQNYFYGEYVYLQLHRSANGGLSGSDIYSGISDAGSAANFIAPFVLDPNNQSTLLGGGNSLWRTTNAKASTPAWTSIKSSTGSYISAIAVAPENSDVIWVGHNNGAVYSTVNGTAASPTWTLRSSGLPARYCSRIAITPGNPNSVYVTFGGYSSGNVWRTSDGGSTWSNITGNLPAAPVNSIVIASADTNTLYVGTDVGVFGSSDNGAHWSTGNDGPASVSVSELFWMGPKLIAATHGRGMWCITPAIGAPNLVNYAALISGGNSDNFVDPNECLQIDLAIQNSGGTPATNISGTLSTTTAGVLITQSNSVYSNLGNGASGFNATPFRLSTSPSFVCGTAVILNLALTCGGGSNVTTFVLPSGGSNYSMTVSSGATLVPGVTDVGNHGDDVSTAITLPFPTSFYGQVFSTATVDSNGRLLFGAGSSDYQNTCIPAGNPATIYALWDDLRTDTSASGIFISTNGVAPNRIFNIEWRSTYYSGGAAANFEIRLYESSPRVDVVYGVVNDTGTSATVGVESDSTRFVQYECNSGGISNGLQLVFQQSCTDGGGPCAPVANFTGDPLAGAAPLSVTFTNLSLNATNYSWAFGDGNTSSLFNPTNVYTNAGVFSVSLTASGGGGSNTLTLTNYILVTNQAPTFVLQPSSQLAVPGTNVSFTASVTGTVPLSYQWEHNGASLPGATSSGLLLTNVGFADAGNYTVIVTNAGGSATSVVATLSVIYLSGFISVDGSPYFETFDEMGPAGTNAPYGWYVGSGGSALSTGVLSPSTGATVLGRNYNFGSSGSPERALGSVATSGLQRDTEARFVNVSAKWLTAINISYTGEQWRCGGASAVINSLVLQYSRDGTSFTNMGAQFDFNSPTVTTTASALDGNVSTNRLTGLGGLFSLPAAVTNGQIFYLRWADIDDTGNDMGIALDDLVLTFNLIDPPPPVFAAFAADVTNGVSPLTVTFTNQSAGATNYLWNFGDGNISSLLNPTNTYTNAGSYSVTLAASGVGGTNSLTLTNYVVVTNPPPPPVVADFAADQTNGGAPLVVTFTNLSTGATNYQWTFGDGNVSAGLNPTNTYTDAGTYSVTLIATGPGGTNELTLTNCIVVTNAPPPPVVADFTAGPTNGPTPLLVTFTNLSTGATNYEWAFGDGNVSTALHPTNTYANAGTYSVTLLATGPGGTNELTFINYIVTTNPPMPSVVVNFAAAPTNGAAPLTVTFTNLSTSATNYLWDFGDGDQTVATDPIHTYTNAGSYSVTLTAFTETETNTLARTNYIVVAAPPLLLVTPPSLDFGLVLTGATAQASFVVSNAGGTVLNGSATIASSPFILMSTNPFAVAPSASTNVAIEFVPANAGLFSNVVTFATDGGHATNTVTGRALFTPFLTVLAAEPTNFDFSFESFEGFTYIIDYKDYLTDPSWHSLSTNIGTGSSITSTNPVGAAPWRFYRLRVQ